MTRTTSIKTDLKNGLTVFGYELKKCRTTLIIYAVLAVFLTTVTYALTWVKRSGMFMSGYTDNSSQTALLSCQISALLIFLLTSVFTIIYTIRVFSYLHNKRKADRINPLPVKSGVLFIGKALAAYVASIVPALFFIGIICVITACLGTTPHSEVFSLFGKIPLGAIACISLYGLLAICCGTSVNAVLTFLAICACYPVSATLVKGMINSFFFGLPDIISGENFLMKALNPLAAYDGVNVIYWILFTVGCFALSIFLLRRRKAELSQTGFAFRMPCYVVEVLVTFLAGMILGVVFGALNVLNHGFAGFAFGFVLGGGTAFVIAHVILFTGFSRILKSLIFVGSAAVLAIGFAAVCCFAAPSYIGYLPERDKIESAGFVYFTPEMLGFRAFADDARVTREAAEDHTDIESIDAVYRIHQAYVDDISKFSLSRKFRNVINFTNMAKKAVAYKLKDGSTVTRSYDLSYFTPGLLDYIGYDENDVSYLNSFSLSASDEELLENTPQYREKYSIIGRLTAEDLTGVTVSYNYELFTVTSREDMEKLLTAYRNDYIALGDENSYSDVRIDFDYEMSSVGNPTVFSLLGFEERINYIYDIAGSCYVTGYYTETYKVMKEIGILDASGRVNRQSPYYESNGQTDPFSGFNFDADWSDEINNTAYKKGDVIPLVNETGSFVAPWDCTEKMDLTVVSYYDIYDELLMFESSSKDDWISNDTGRVDANDYAKDFQILQVLTRETELVENGIYGTARVKANGKEEILRYMQLGDIYSPVFFLTDKVSDEEMNSILKSYRMY